MYTTKLNEKLDKYVSVIFVLGQGLFSSRVNIVRFCTSPENSLSFHKTFLLSVTIKKLLNVPQNIFYCYHYIKYYRVLTEISLFP